MNYNAILVKWMAAFEKGSWNTAPKSGISDEMLIRYVFDPSKGGWKNGKKPTGIRERQKPIVDDLTPGETRNQAQALFSAYCKSQGITDAHIAKTVARLKNIRHQRQRK